MLNRNQKIINKDFLKSNKREAPNKIFGLALYNKWNFKVGRKQKKMMPIESSLIR